MLVIFTLLAPGRELAKTATVVWRVRGLSHTDDSRVPPHPGSRRCCVVRPAGSRRRGTLSSRIDGALRATALLPFRESRRQRFWISRQTGHVRAQGLLALTGINPAQQEKRMQRKRTASK